MSVLLKNIQWLPFPSHVGPLSCLLQVVSQSGLRSGPQMLCTLSCPGVLALTIPLFGQLLATLPPLPPLS